MSRYACYKTGSNITRDIDPDDIEKIEKELRATHVWTSINRTIRWARLYGGAIAVILLEGQDLSTPLRVETVGQGQFKGLAVIDRWMMQPYLAELVTDYGPYVGLPKYYDITVTNGPIPPQPRFREGSTVAPQPIPDVPAHVSTIQ